MRREGHRINYVMAACFFAAPSHPGGVQRGGADRTVRVFRYHRRNINERREEGGGPLQPPAYRAPLYLWQAAHLRVAAI